MVRSYKVLLDTNMLLTPFELKIDIKSEIGRILGGKVKFFVLRKVLREAEHKKKGIGVKMIEALGAEVIEGRARYKTDDAIIETAKEGFIVATNDSEIRRRLRKYSIPCIFVRGKKRLDIEGYVGDLDV